MSCGVCSNAGVANACSVLCLRRCTDYHRRPRSQVLVSMRAATASSRLPVSTDCDKTYVRSTGHVYDVVRARLPSSQLPSMMRTYLPYITRLSYKYQPFLMITQPEIRSAGSLRPRYSAAGRQACKTTGTIDVGETRASCHAQFASSPTNVSLTTVPGGGYVPASALLRSRVYSASQPLQTLFDISVTDTPTLVYQLQLTCDLENSKLRIMRPNVKIRRQPSPSWQDYVQAFGVRGEQMPLSVCMGVAGGQAQAIVSDCHVRFSSSAILVVCAHVMHATGRVARSGVAALHRVWLQFPFTATSYAHATKCSRNAYIHSDMAEPIDQLFQHTSAGEDGHVSF